MTTRAHRDTTRSSPAHGSRESGWPLYVPPVQIAERVHHYDHMLFWQVRGASQLVLDDVPHSLDAGRAFWIPASTRHSLQVQANSVLLPLFFPVAEHATTLSGVVGFEVDEDLRTLMLAYLQSQVSIIRPAANIARQILALVEEHPSPAPKLPMPQSPAAAAVAETLRFNPGDDRGAEQLAAEVHISLRTLERAFRAETGLTLRQWRLRNRMETAAILLRSGSSGIEAVAHRVGYTNANAFRRAFKEHFGVTPSEHVAGLDRLDEEAPLAPGPPRFRGAAPYGI